MKIGSSLNVVVRVNTIHTAGPNGRRKTLSTLIVRMDGTPIADRVISGKWDANSALVEFRKFPNRFTGRTGFTPETLKAVAA